MNPQIDLTHAGASIVKTIKRIDRLKYREDIELFPTEYSRRLATILIVDVARLAPIYFFTPFINGDDLGGVRILWINPSTGAQLRLIVPPATDHKLYIYYENEIDSGLDFNVSGRVLSQYLEWLWEENCQKQGKLGDIIRGVVA